MEISVQLQFLRVVSYFRRAVSAIYALFRDFTQRIVVIPYLRFGDGQWRTEGGLGFKTPTPTPKFRSFDKVEPDCKSSGKCLVFLFQHPN